MENIEIKRLEICNDRNFYIETVDNNYYVFYNSVRHFACKISRLDLALFNLIYIYKDINYILQKIDCQYQEYVKNLYEKVCNSKVLDTDIYDHNIVYQQPSTFYLHLTYKCNLGCIYCYNKEIRKDFRELNLTEWIYIINQILPYAERIILTGGEPFMFNEISNIIQYIRNKSEKIKLEIISNCMCDFLNFPDLYNVFNNIDCVTFSCDNISNVNQTRKNFEPELFKKNIRFLRNKFPNLSILVSSIFIKGAEEELQLIRDFCNNTNISFRTVLVIPNHINEIDMLPSVEDYKKSLFDGDSQLDSIRQYCGAGIGSCSIDPLGNVYPCQSMHYPAFCYGNIFNTNFDLLLKCDISQYIRSELSVDNIEVCKDCNVRYICGAGCRAATYKIEGNALSYPKTLCPYYKELSKHKLKNIPLHIL